ncbi:MAG: tripartite tricarboxylate transporter TctB family protein [Kiloniellaceae bacterium]
MANKNPSGAREGAGYRAPSLFHKTDLLLAGIILAVCAGLYYTTTTFAEVPPLLQQGISPPFFPRLILGTIVVLTLMLPFEHVVKARKGQSPDEDRARRIKRITHITAVFLIGLLIIMPYLGTFPTMILSCAVFPLLWGERRYWLIAAYAAAFPVLVSILFVTVLKVNFLPGVVGYIFR